MVQWCSTKIHHVSFPWRPIGTPKTLLQEFFLIFEFWKLKKDLRRFTSWVLKMTPTLKNFVWALIWFNFDSIFWFNCYENLYFLNIFWWKFRTNEKFWKTKFVPVQKACRPYFKGSLVSLRRFWKFQKFSFLQGLKKAKSQTIKKPTHRNSNRRRWLLHSKIG